MFVVISILSIGGFLFYNSKLTSSVNSNASAVNSNAVNASAVNSNAVNASVVNSNAVNASAVNSNSTNVSISPPEAMAEIASLEIEASNYKMQIVDIDRKIDKNKKEKSNVITTIEDEQERLDAIDLYIKTSSEKLERYKKTHKELKLKVSLLEPVVQKLRTECLNVFVLVRAFQESCKQFTLKERDLSILKKDVESYTNRISITDSAVDEKKAEKIVVENTIKGEQEKINEIEKSIQELKTLLKATKGQLEGVNELILKNQIIISGTF